MEARERLSVAVNRPDLVSLVDIFDIGQVRSRTTSEGPALAAWTDIVPLDHLVQRRRLDVEQLRCALLNATRGFEG